MQAGIWQITPPGTLRFCFNAHSRQIVVESSRDASGEIQDEQVAKADAGRRPSELSHHRTIRNLNKSCAFLYGSN
jgi:hypothetical protein